jgi:murein DD-endopeptidase MepM/ murein hydrolase activator NlpD
MSGFAVMVGQTVVRGQVIGYVGTTGRTTGANLHYEVRIHNAPVNPHKYMLRHDCGFGVGEGWAVAQFRSQIKAP